ncbi:hypothetical protein PoB_007190400 [Plakobranchus ocellatus]|uniref:Peptidase S1 domain-containing protein n=1 Tax=Plakobranchus ocellatus TaxID=259542 RepID=A0AAV4DMI9_9GAST|nr:hypothetical protein PoB_007190400 [Plakobranchus ocellatus]
MERKRLRTGLNIFEKCAASAESLTYEALFAKDLGMTETQRSFEKDELLSKIKQCPKNPGHTDFFPVGCIGLLNLPAVCRDKQVLNYLRLFSRLTVKLTCLFTSSMRQGPYKLLGQKIGHASRRLATGFAWLPNHIEQMPCTITNCPYGEHPHSVYGFIRILTNKHVVYDESEAVATQGLFWDEEVRGVTYSAASRCIQVQCVGLDFSQGDNDAAHLRCVTHDSYLCEELKQEMSQLREIYNSIPIGVWQGAENFCAAISHPHGMRKTISIGRHIRMVETISNAHAHYHTCATCPGSSGAPVLYTNTDIKGALPMWVPAIHSYHCPTDGYNCAFK